MTYPITITRSVTVNLTVRDWELYDDMPRVADAATALNIAASEALSLPTADEAWRHWTPISDKWMRYGAADTEPRSVFTDLVRQVFGEDA